ncbi:MAG: regulatory protein RecX [Xanthomonadales bacterium]|nr:regulatory protein RecX [Xanthomonadales bacterium]
MRPERPDRAAPRGRRDHPSTTLELRERTPEQWRSEAQARAIVLLSRREHSPQELRNKLQSKGFPEDAVIDVMEALQRDGLLSSERFVEARLRQGLRQGHGPRRIRQRLREAGVDPAQLQHALEAHDDDVDWLAQAREACDKRFGTEAPAAAREWARRARFLQGRGFDEAVIRKLLGRCPRP